MLARFALARLRAQAPASSARDVAQISRQLARTYLTSTTATTHLAIAPAVQSFRSYATATKTKPKPKAKATTKKSPARKTATRKTATRKTSAKKPVKKRAVKKPAKKRVAKKPAKKPAPKRRGLTERQKMLKEKAKTKEKIAQLKATALEDQPKKLPNSAYALFVTDYFRKIPQAEKEGVSIVTLSKQLSNDFKNLGSSELERLQSQAAENSKRNQELHSKWIRSHTPQQIMEANKARASLKRMLTSYKKKKIVDDRLVKAASSVWLIFFMEKMKAGAAEGKVPEQAKTIAQEWRSLSPSQKQKYEDLHRQDMQRYFKEYKNVYGEEHPKAV